MTYNNFKPVRIVVSLLFFLSVVLIFSDIYHLIPEWLIQIITYLQFIPSLIKFINNPVFAVSGFIVILFLTLLFGRIYCSSVCPVGTLLDIFSRIGRLFGKEKEFIYRKPNNPIRFPILIMTVILWISGSMFLINLLDPYSIFGRMWNILIKPLVIYFNNLVGWILKFFNIYSVYQIDVPANDLMIIFIPVIYLIILIIFGMFYGRQYCNLVCPVGIFLSLISRFSFFKIEFDKDSCTLCGDCESVCKANCIDHEVMKLDFDRCVSCFNCFRSCPVDGFKYKFAYRKKEKIMKVSVEKRDFMFQSMLALGSLVSLTSCSTGLDKKEAKENNLSVYPIVPPGAGNVENFTSKCTACYLCVSACPGNVIKPTIIDYGLNGMFQPAMKYKYGFCNFDCVRCTEICPSGAILPLTIDQKHTTQIGKMKFVKENCVVETEKKDCGACAEHCPTKAVKMVDYGKLKIPETDDEICVGCGACEYACPTQPRKAIYVESNYIHEKAKEPKTEKKKYIETEEFPF
jgi:ferredoxin